MQALHIPAAPAVGEGVLGPRAAFPASQENPDSSSAVKAEDLLELGCFGAPHGVRGDIRLFPTTDSAKERLTQPGLRCLPDFPCIPHFSSEYAFRCCPGAR